MITDKHNKPDIPDMDARHSSEYSSFESAYWQMLIHKEAHTSRDNDYAKAEIEHMFNVWNGRFGTDAQPRWKRDV